MIQQSDAERIWIALKCWSVEKQAFAKKLANFGDCHTLAIVAWWIFANYITDGRTFELLFETRFCISGRVHCLRSPCRSQKFWTKNRKILIFFWTGHSAMLRRKSFVFWACVFSLSFHAVRKNALFLFFRSLLFWYSLYKFCFSVDQTFLRNSGAFTVRNPAFKILLKIGKNSQGRPKSKVHEKNHRPKCFFSN